jgi:hypothetical protein
MRHSKFLELVFGSILETCRRNSYVLDNTFLKEVVLASVRQFGRDQVLAATTQITDATVREKVEKAVRSAPAS